MKQLGRNVVFPEHKKLSFMQQEFIGRNSCGHLVCIFENRKGQDVVMQ